MTKCRECQQQISEKDIACPGCGAKYPGVEIWDGWGYEYKSKAMIMGLPLLHISFKYGPNKIPVPAVGIISIGQFGMGIFNVSQFGVGLFSLSQFTVAGYAVAQFGIAYKLVAQIGIYLEEGHGQIIMSLAEVLANF